MLAKKKHIEKIEKSNINIRYVCPNTDERIYLKVNTEDFSFGESECELCGSHGYLYISINNCKSCGKNHTIDIQDW